MAVDWSSLPLELLHLIGTNGLDSTSSTSRHFRSVCSWWRTALPLPKQPPRLLLPPSIKFLSSQVHHCDVRLVKHSIHLLISLSSSPVTFSLIKVEDDEHSKSNALSLLHPFSRENYIKDTNSTFDISNFQTFELGHEFVLRNIGSNDDDQEGLYNMEREKVALCHDANDVQNFIVLSTHSNTGKLLMYSSITNEWVFMDDTALGYDDRSIFVNEWSLLYVDVVYHKGKFYAVTDSGRTVTIEVKKDSFIVVTLMVNSIVGGDKKRFVKSGNELLLVDFSTSSTPDMVEVNAVDVFKLDENERRWVIVKDLGDRTLFLSDYSSFCTSELPKHIGNFIYFHFKPEKYFLERKMAGIEDKNGLKGNEICVFDYGKGFLTPFEEQIEVSKLFCWPPCL